MNNIIVGDCIETMRQLIAARTKVQMCVTSPPYWGLRDYGVAGQLGLEPTPQEYVANMVEVFHLVRELLADDGTLWLNLGDNYAGSRTGEQGASGQMADREVSKHRGNIAVTKTAPGLKSKDLVGIPWRVAFALQEDGWYLRQDIIWSKPNPMPESVRDRCTKAHEYIFLLAKSERYYYDAAEIAEPGVAGEHTTTAKSFGGQAAGANRIPTGNQKPGTTWKWGNTRNKRSVWTVPTSPYPEAHFATFPSKLIEPCILAGSRPGDVVFDPFMGSGTTAKVATSLGRQYLGCELNPEYIKLADDRSKVTMGLAL